MESRITAVSFFLNITNLDSYLKIVAAANILLSNPQQSSITSSLIVRHTKNSALTARLSRIWHCFRCNSSSIGHDPKCSSSPGFSSIYLHDWILKVFKFPQYDKADSHPPSILWLHTVNSSNIWQHIPIALIPS